MIDVYSPKHEQVIIRDKLNNNKIIAAGKIVNNKNIPVDCVTLDNKFYFLLKENCYYDVKEVDEEFEIQFNPLLTSIPIKLWREVYENLDNNCIYRDFTIDEADPEVVEILQTLNKIDNIRTTSSCSGHNTSHVYIDIAFKNFNVLFNFVKLLDNNQFRDKLCLSTSETITNNSDEEIILKLYTIEYGDSAYRIIDMLNEKLKELFL